MELMVVLVIVGILSIIAFPSYQDYLRRGKRTDGQTALLNLAGQMERFFTENNSYIDGPGNGQTFPFNSAGGYYQLSQANMTLSAYTLQATALGDQSNDVAYDSTTGQSVSCATLTLNQMGQKTPLACWS